MKPLKEKYSGLNFIAKFIVVVALLGMGAAFILIIITAATFFSQQGDDFFLIEAFVTLFVSVLLFVIGEVSKLLIEIKNNTSKPTIPETENKESNQ